MRAFMIAVFVFVVLASTSFSVCFLGLGGNALWYLQSRGCTGNELSCPVSYTLAPEWVHFLMFVVFLLIAFVFAFLAFVAADK